jgi:hypothetical protein
MMKRRKAGPRRRLPTFEQLEPRAMLAASFPTAAEVSIAAAASVEILLADETLADEANATPNVNQASPWSEVAAQFGLRAQAFGGIFALNFTAAPAEPMDGSGLSVPEPLFHQREEPTLELAGVPDSVTPFSWVNKSVASYAGAPSIAAMGASAPEPVGEAIVVTTIAMPKPLAETGNANGMVFVPAPGNRGYQSGQPRPELLPLASDLRLLQNFNASRDERLIVEPGVESPQHSESRLAEARESAFASGEADEEVPALTGRPRHLKSLFFDHYATAATVGTLVGSD